MTTAMRERHEISEEHTWDLESIFSNRESWEDEIKNVESLIDKLGEYKGTLGNDAATLLGWFEYSESTFFKLGKILAYAMLHYAVDTRNTEHAAMSDRAQGLYARAMGQASFTFPEILEIGEEKLNSFMDAEPKLKVYQHFFDQVLRERAFTLSSDIESILSRLGDPFSTAASIHGTMVDADLKFEPAISSSGEEVDIFQGNIGKLLSSSDRELRRSAWTKYTDGFLGFKNSMAKCLATGVKQDVFKVRTRGYDSSLHMALHQDGIPLEVFHSLIDTFKKNLPTWHRYWDVRKKALGLSEFHPYDVKAPLGNFNSPVTFDQSMEWIAEGMKPLGDEYVDAMVNGVREERWVDIYPNVGKRSGAFSAGRYGTKPFILMSYNDDFFALSTLAHELGHSMHSYHSRRTQPYVYAHYSLFVAEVASNFNQALVRDYLLKQSDDVDFQIAVIEEAMANFHRYFFIMPTLARFELEIHERVERGEALTADSLNQLMASLFAEGYGDGVVVDVDRVGITWAQFATHLYRQFYVYQYATGISGAHALANRVLTEGESARQEYIEFLSAGDSLYAIDALKRAGADMTTPEPVESTFKVLEGYVEKLASLLGVE